MYRGVYILERKDQWNWFQGSDNRKGVTSKSDIIGDIIDDSIGGSRPLPEYE